MSDTTFSTDELLEELAQAEPGDRLDRLGRYGPPDRVLLRLIDDISKLSIVDAEDAVRATEFVITLSDLVDSPLARARARRACTRAMAYAGRFDDAMAIGSEASRIALEAKCLEEAGRAQLALMHPLIETGQVARAIQAGRAARDLFEQLDEPALIARADINLGVVHQRSDNPQEAMVCFDRARPHFRDDLLTHGHLENNRGEALVALNDFKGAEQAFLEARAAFEANQATLTAAIAESNLADLAVRRGQLARAMNYFEHARERLESTHSITHLSRLLAEQADAHLLLGLPEDALRGYETALKQLVECGLALEAARARAGMGAALYRLGRFAESETALAAAALGFEEMNHTAARARVDLIRAEIALCEGRTGTAKTIAMRCLAVLHDRPAESAQVRHLLARAYMIGDEDERAFAEINSGLADAEHLDLPPLLADLFHTRGSMHLQAGRFEEARSDLQRAVEQIDRVHGSLQARRFRMAYLGDRTVAYEDLVRACLALDGPRTLQQGFATVERCKSRVLLDEMRQAISDDAGEPEAPRRRAELSLARKIAAVRAELDALYSRIADEQIHPRGAGGQDLRAVMRRRESELESLEARLSIHGRDHRFQRDAIQLGDLPDELIEDAAIVEYFVARGELFAFVIGPDRSLANWSLGDVSQLEALAERLRFQIERGLHANAKRPAQRERMIQEYEREARNLYDRLLRPFEHVLAGRRRVTIIPHGPLHSIPMQALHDGRCHLIDRHEVHFAPSLGMLAQIISCDPADHDPAHDLLSIGVSDRTAPGMEREADLIADRYATSRRLLGDRATIESVSRAMPLARRIHLACHGMFFSDSPLGSGIRLADGWLTARRIYTMSLAAELVTLSGCETGRAQVVVGDELMGLVRSLLVAGGKSMLVTQWNVDDESAVELMSRFYEHLGTGPLTFGRRAQAIRAAQSDAIARRSHPALWAPYVLIGTP